jgi:hypothetical protein
MVLAQQSVSREHVAERVILPLERVGSRHAGETAELLLGQNANRMSARLRVQLLRPFQLVRRVSNGAARSAVGQFVVCIGCRTETFGADNQHRRLRVDIVGRHAAEARDELARILAPERTELSCKNDELTRKRDATRLRRG